MRKDHDVLVQGNDAIDAAITTGLAVSARVRHFAAKSWRSIARK
jgi:gamma-glutamyltranspeptidase